jgi:hypothetical protein
MSLPPTPPSLLSKQRIVNLATPDTNITALQSTQPQVHQAIKNMGTSIQQLTNSIFPPPPIPHYRGRVILPGVLAVAADVLAHRYHVVLPTDPSGYWTFTQINVTGCYVTLKVPPTTGICSIDVLMSQKKGTTPFKSLFQPGFNPMIPAGVVSTHNVKFAINTFFQDDLGRVDILATDGIANGAEIVLFGNYTAVENIVA